MSIEKDWQDVTIYNVSFTSTTSNHTFNRVLVFNDYPSLEEVKTIILEKFPTIKKIESLCEWQTALLAK